MKKAPIIFSKPLKRVKPPSLPRLINALGIRHVGEETANLLAEHYKDLDDLGSASREKLMTVPSIGPKIADSIIAFFHEEENREIPGETAPGRSLAAAGIGARRSAVIRAKNL